MPIHWFQSCYQNDNLSTLHPRGTVFFMPASVHLYLRFSLPVQEALLTRDYVLSTLHVTILLTVLLLLILSQGTISHVP